MRLPLPKITKSEISGHPRYRVSSRSLRAGRPGTTGRWRRLTDGRRRSCSATSASAIATTRQASSRNTSRSSTRKGRRLPWDTSPRGIQAEERLPLIIYCLQNVDRCSLGLLHFRDANSFTIISVGGFAYEIPRDGRLRWLPKQKPRHQ